MDDKRLAFRLLTAVLEQHRPLEEALDKLPQAEPRNRAAAHRLAAAVLRRTASLDAVLQPHLLRAPPPAVRTVLLIGAAGLLLLDTPPHAAVGTAVDLARAEKLAPFAKLVNAVLRRVSESGAAAFAELDAPRLDTPAWLWASWGPAARDIWQGHQAEAPLDIFVKPGATPPEGGTPLPTGGIRFPAGTRPMELAGYAEGSFWVQDAAASLPATLLAPRPGETVLDLCAAPGGKTAQLIAAGAAVTAVEREPRRMLRLRENLTRLKLEATLVEADALTWQPPAPVDAILLDAPCSATGTIRRHPDVPHIKREKDISALAAQQHALLAAAADMLKPGGRLIYAVCSLQPQEGPGQLASLPAGLRHDPFAADELAAIPEALSEGCLRTHPGMWGKRGGLDGFFAARLVRG